MPLSFRGSCNECGYETPELKPGGFAILVTDRDEDRRRRQGEPVPVVLHPFTDYVLDEFGLSFATSAWGGQLVEIQNLICRDCGHITESRRLTAGGVAIGCGGCSAIAVMGLITGITIGFLIGNPFIGAGIGVALCVFSATVIEFGASRLVRWRYRERADAVDRPRMCYHCGGWNCVPLGTRGVGPFPCPDCGGISVRLVPIARTGGSN